ncbi:hypothetical protein [Aquimarina longa]|uniref:hypothetical protein n=1 Tax=Aquimarina longa TaxID=1080221 RepID=UPI0007815BB9|nr:hypothetical protein [Aquimarina longa]
MKDFNISLTVPAENKEQLQEKLQAFQDLQDHLEHEDFITSTSIIVEHPDIVDFIKEVIPEEGEELSMTDYIKIAKKAFERFS